MNAQTFPCNRCATPLALTATADGVITCPKCGTGHPVIQAGIADAVADAVHGGPPGTSVAPPPSPATVRKRPKTDWRNPVPPPQAEAEPEIAPPPPTTLTTPDTSAREEYAPPDSSVVDELVGKSDIYAAATQQKTTSYYAAIPTPAAGFTGFPSEEIARPATARLLPGEEPDPDDRKQTGYYASVPTPAVGVSGLPGVLPRAPGEQSRAAQMSGGTRGMRSRGTNRSEPMSIAEFHGRKVARIGAAAFAIGALPTLIDAQMSSSSALSGAPSLIGFAPPIGALAATVMLRGRARGIALLAAGLAMLALGFATAGVGASADWPIWVAFVLGPVCAVGAGIHNMVAGGTPQPAQHAAAVPAMTVAVSQGALEEQVLQLQRDLETGRIDKAVFEFRHAKLLGQAGRSATGPGAGS